MANPEPWEIGAFPSACAICKQVHWFRPADPSVPRPCGHEFRRLPGDPPDKPEQWWLAMCRWPRRDERDQLIAHLENLNLAEDNWGIPKAKPDG